jgi:hypothetical protein
MRLLPKKIKPIHMVVGAGLVVVAIILYKKRMSFGLATSSETDPFGNMVLNDAGNPCPMNQVVRAQAGNLFCCPYVPGPDGSCNP